MVRQPSFPWGDAKRRHDLRKPYMAFAFPGHEPLGTRRDPLREAVISKLLWGSEGTWNGVDLNGTREQIYFRTLDVYAFPTGGSPTQMGVVSKSWYTENHRRPPLVHCTGRTGKAAKRACLEWNGANYFEWSRISSIVQSARRST